MDRLTVAILIFDGVEVLDFTGPFEAFSRTRLVPGVRSRLSEDSAPFHVVTVAPTTDAVRATGGLRVIPDHSFDDVPAVDILVLPGGFGTRALLEDAVALDWIRETARSAQRVTSVCTGALLLGRVGLLAGRRATTHRSALELLASVDPSIVVERERRVVFADRIVTSAGVSAGIDMALDLVQQLHGEAVADDTAGYMEYPRHPISARAPSTRKDRNPD